jgi:hypothetical protein
MGRLFGLILSLAGGIALGLGAYGLLTPPASGWVSAAGARTLGLALAPALALWFSAWLAFTLDAILRELRALRESSARVGGTVTRLSKTIEGARARQRAEPSLTRRS